MEFNTVTAAELIEMLQDLPPEAKIAFSSNYGDYHRTQQVHSIQGVFKQVYLFETAYSDSGFAIKGRDDEDEDAVGDDNVYVVK